jgi:acetoin utilization protein AcuB
MTPNVHSASPDTTIAEALKVTRSERIRHLPVLQDGQLVGLVTGRDLRLAMPPIWAEEHDELLEQLNTRRVREVMVTDIITTTATTPIEEAAKLMYANRVGCLPVLDGEKLVGIVTETDMLRALVELFGAKQPSSRLEVHMPNKPGELARVVRLVGIEHRINITGLIVTSMESDDIATAIMQLQTLNPSPIIRALRKLGYTVGWPSLELDQTESLDGDEFLSSPFNLPNRVPIES